MTRIRLLLLPLAILAVLLGAAMASPVAATDSNHPDYWLARYPNAVACYKYGPNADNAHGSDDGKVVTLNPFQPEWPGDRWEVLVVKAGSEGDDGNGNAIYELPEAGVEYAAADGKDISHWIICKGETPEPTPTPEVTPSPSPSPEPTPTPTATSTPTPSPTATPTTSTPPTPTPETSLVPPTETTQPTPPSELPQTDTVEARTADGPSPWLGVMMLVIACLALLAILADLSKRRPR